MSPSTVEAHTDDHHLVAHHFENIEQQRDAASLGMWLFLASEILFFGGVFTGYAMMRREYATGFTAATTRLSAGLGAANTAVLLTSSLTMALAVWAAQTRRRRALQVCLGLTLLFGTAFLCIKGYEWHHEYEVGLLPGPTFGVSPSGEPVLDSKGDPVSSEQLKSMQLFFVFYFIITGLHGLHMIVGLGVLGIQLVMAVRSSFGIDDYGPIELAGLYWHFVDIVWIFVFPLLYLLRS